MHRVFVLSHQWWPVACGWSPQSSAGWYGSHLRSTNPLHNCTVALLVCLQLFVTWNEMEWKFLILCRNAPSACKASLPGRSAKNKERKKKIKKKLQTLDKATNPRMTKSHKGEGGSTVHQTGFQLQLSLPPIICCRIETSAACEEACRFKPSIIGREWIQWACAHAHFDIACEIKKAFEK